MKKKATPTTPYGQYQAKMREGRKWLKQGAKGIGYLREQEDIVDTLYFTNIDIGSRYVDCINAMRGIEYPVQFRAMVDAFIIDLKSQMSKDTTVAESLTVNAQQLDLLYQFAIQPAPMKPANEPIEGLDE